MKKAVLIILGITLLLPSFDEYNRAYQSSLWTSRSQRRYPAKSYDLQFRFGTEIDDLRPWTRVRLGFPIKPITVDILTEPVIVQVRFETLHNIVNIIVALIGILGVWIFRIRRRKKITKTGSNTTLEPTTGAPHRIA
jgi:hypothetical protein